MIVYVESNFALEIACDQEQHESANAILSMAENNEIDLAFPGFAISEPFSSLMYRAGKRSVLYSSLEITLGQIQQSKGFKHTAQEMLSLLPTLKKMHEKEVEDLYATFERMLTGGRSIGTDLLSFQESLVYQASLGLFPQDSIIFATVMNDLRERPEEEVKCFLSRDKKAFADENDRLVKKGNQSKSESKIRAGIELKQYNCRYISNFDDGLSYIKRFA